MVLVLLATSGAAGAAKPEVPASSLVERVTSELVLIEAYVTDLRGNPIEGLTADNFVLQVDGKVAPIASVEYRELGPGGAAAAPAPIALDGQGPSEPEPSQAGRRFVLYFEDDLSAAQGLAMARHAAAQFIGTSLRPSDQVALVAHGRRVRVLCDFTTDRAELQRALEASLQDKQRVSNFASDLLQNEKMLRDGYRDSAMTDKVKWNEAAPKDASVLRVDSLITSFAKADEVRVRDSFDAIRSVIASLVPWPGYKAVVYMGDGIPENPASYYLDRLHDIPALASDPRLSSDVEVLNLRSEFKAVVDAAGAGGVTVHTIDTAGIASADSFGTPGSSVRRAALSRSNTLPTLALNTGGISSSSNDPIKGLAQAEESSRAYYLIAYAPEGPPDGRTHSVQLRVKKVSAHLSWRRQFVRLRPEEARERLLQSAYLLPELYPRLGLDLSVVAGPSDRTGRVADLVLHVPSDRILYLPEADGATARLDVGLVALDASRGEVLRLSRSVTIRLGAGTAGRARPGLNLFHRMHLPAAADTITAVVTDLSTGAVGALRIGGPLRVDDDPAVAGLSIYSLVERSLWIEIETAADAGPTEAIVKDEQLGPALKSIFVVGEPLACGFKLNESRQGGDERVTVLIRKGEATVKTVELDADSGLASGTVKARLPVEDLPAGEYLLLVRAQRAGRPIDLARRPFRLLPAAVAAIAPAAANPATR